MAGKVTRSGDHKRQPCRRRAAGVSCRCSTGSTTSAPVLDVEAVDGDAELRRAALGGVALVWRPVERPVERPTDSFPCGAVLAKFDYLDDRLPARGLDHVDHV